MSSRELSPSLTSHRDRHHEAWKRFASVAALRGLSLGLATAVVLPIALKVSHGMDESRRKHQQEVSTDLMQLYPGIEVTRVIPSYESPQPEGAASRNVGSIEFINALGNTCSITYVQVEQIGQTMPRHLDFGNPTCTDKQPN